MNDVAAVANDSAFVGTVLLANSGPVITVRVFGLLPIELTDFMLIVTIEFVAAPGMVIGEVALPADV